LVEGRQAYARIVNSVFWHLPRFEKVTLVGHGEDRERRIGQDQIELGKLLPVGKISAA
jgi:hypothetical protein